jgi:large repetitive protein
MVWVLKNSAGANASDYYGAAPDYVWVVDESSAASFPAYNGSPSAAGASTEAPGAAPTATQTVAPAPASDPHVSAAAGTSGADVFALDRGAVAAAMATPPSPVQIQGFSAAQGDKIDFSAVLAASYAPLSADSAQLRVTDHGGAAASLEFNVGNASHAFWVSLAQLDGIHASDAVNVSLDAAHTVHLTALWAI